LKFAAVAMVLQDVGALLLFGSLNTITMKIVITTSGVGLDGETKVFRKPWFATLAMFIGMSLANFFDGEMRQAIWPRNMDEPLLGEGGDRPDRRVWKRRMLLCLIPSVFDLLATGLCAVGFLYLPASTWQLLRGAEMVFAAIFTVLFLRRRVYGFQWFGLLSSILGVTMVGIAGVGAAKEQNELAAHGDASAAAIATPTSLVILGGLFALSGQIVQAAQATAEEWLLDDNIPETQVIGFQGVWGLLVMLLVVFPLMYMLPGEDNGHLEDTFDTLAMLASNPHLVGMFCLYILSCGTYNVAGIRVTGKLSAVHRVMIEALRTCILWVFGVTVHHYEPLSPFGEALNNFSIVEVLGFLMLIKGQAVYKKLWKYRCFEYPA